MRVLIEGLPPRVGRWQLLLTRLTPAAANGWLGRREIDERHDQPRHRSRRLKCMAGRMNWDRVRRERLLTKDLQPGEPDRWEPMKPLVGSRRRSQGKPKVNARQTRRVQRPALQPPGAQEPLVLERRTSSGGFWKGKPAKTDPTLSGSRKDKARVARRQLVRTVSKEYDPLQSYLEGQPSEEPASLTTRPGFGPTAGVQ
jgi:hypothetical protein